MSDVPWWTTLVATVVGAFASFLGTAFLEAQKERRAMRRTKMTEAMIPLCSSVENVLEQIEEMEIDYDLDIPSLYLKADKRPYLEQEILEDLELYRIACDDFYDTWEQEKKSIYKEYKSWLRAELNKCDIIHEIVDVHVGVDRDNGIIDRMLLTKNPRSLLDQVSSVNFEFDINDPKNNKNHFIRFNSVFREKYLTTRIDEQTDSEKVDYEVYNYLVSLHDVDKLEELIEKTKTKEKLRELKKKAVLLKNDLDACISRIAG